jgi:hypothetical protein
MPGCEMSARRGNLNRKDGPLNDHDDCESPRTPKAVFQSGAHWQLDRHSACRPEVFAEHYQEPTVKVATSQGRPRNDTARKFTYVAARTFQINALVGLGEVGADDSDDSLNLSRLAAAK